MGARLKRLGTVLGAGAMFVLVSVLSGMLVAVLAVPLAVSSGVGAKSATHRLHKLPADLTTPPTPQRSKVLDVHGDVMAYFYSENRVSKPLSKIAPIMRNALLSIEDHRFYDHGAFDPKGTLRAFLTNQSGGSVSQGGSSITQQYVKMVLVEKAQATGDKDAVEAARATSYRRKFEELRYALALERRLSKDQILQRYLNIAYFGNGAYGVEAAARQYFSTSAAKLTLSQASMLAGLVRSPDRYDPTRHPKAAVKRRNTVLDRMAELDKITPAAAKKAKRTKFDKSAVSGNRNGCVSTRYPFLCDYVERDLLRTPSLGKSVQDRKKLINRGGLTIKTAIDPKAQRLAQHAVSKAVGPTAPLISTMDMIQPGTGLVVAMAQSRPKMGKHAKKGETYLNYSVSPKMGGGHGFQAGSTFKAFTAAAALRKGIPIGKRFNAKKKVDYSGKSYDSCDGKKKIGNWKVHNATRANGRMNMAKGMAWSVNNYFLQLELATGMCDVVKTAENIGVHSSSSKAPISSFHDKPSFTLGAAEVSPLTMAEAYATFASGGIHCDPIIVSKITTDAGKKLKTRSAHCQRVISADVAHAMSKIMSGVLDGGSASMAHLPDKRPTAGKTGTSDSSTSVWFNGYTPQITGAAMIAEDTNQKPFAKGKSGYRKKGLEDYRVPSNDHRLKGSGAVDVGRDIWKPAMAKYLKDKPKKRFGKPPDKLVHGPKTSMPDVDGMKDKKAIKKLRKAGLTVERKKKHSKKVPKGKLIKFSPNSGKIRTYGTVTAVYSAGKPKKKGS